MKYDTIIVHERTNASLAQRVAKHLGVEALEVGIADFPNGEFNVGEICIEADRAIVIFPKIDDINKQLVQFMLMCGLCENCKKIDAVIPYIPYSRQNSSTIHETIFKTFNALGVSRIITVDIHNDSILRDHNIINILPHEIFGKVVEVVEDVVIIAPDLGAIPRAAQFAEHLKAPLVTIDKNSEMMSNTSSIAERHCIIVDDIIDSGRTINNAISKLRSYNPRAISACITHAFPSQKRKLIGLDKLYTSESFDTQELNSTIPYDHALATALED
ncbi:MAG: ribose-phosphate diphosphokinase [Holosporales bacterium]|nr:ribose-phosphate diphosphokinase [Holosporales bacterium]